VAVVSLRSNFGRRGTYDVDLHTTECERFPATRSVRTQPEGRDFVELVSANSSV
jgi:hypothetical protein